MKCVFLGGTKGSTWRDEMEYLLDQRGLAYFNPVVGDWNEEAYQKELQMRRDCDYTLYAITPRMKGVYSIAEVVEDSVKQPEAAILVLLKIDEDFRFDDSQWKSLQAVGKMVKRNGAQVFESLREVANWLQNDTLT